jgi:hypothetical protein
MPFPRLFFAFLGARFLGLIRHLPRFQHIVNLSNAFQRHKGFVLVGYKEVKKQCVCSGAQTQKTKFDVLLRANSILEQ